LAAIGALVSDRDFLELNALVLCGQNGQVRLESMPHLVATDKHFFDNLDGGIRDVFEWHALHASESVWIRAAVLCVPVHALTLRFSR
jgi:hypothetical protein